MKVVRYRGKENGPRVAVVAAVHGNETCGVTAFDRLRDLSLIRGEAFLIIANEEAMKRNVRYVESDLNRSFGPFPKTREGLIAKELSKILDSCDAMLDIHASFTENSKPFVIAEKQSWEIAACLPASLLTYGWDAIHPGSTDSYMNQRNKIGICLECGYLGDPSCVDIALRGIKAFLGSMGMLDVLTQRQQQTVCKIQSMYRNRASFTLVRKFDDFEVLKEDLIGWDEENPVRVKPGDIIIFARDRLESGSECFVLAKRECQSGRFLQSNW